MAGKRIVIGGYMPALDLNGYPVAGAKLRFYTNLTTTLATVYTSAALTVAHPNPVIADAAGQFPSIFADEATAFSVEITDGDDKPINGLRNRDNVRTSLFFGQEAAESAAETVYVPEATGAVAARTLSDRVSDLVSAKDFAVGDGVVDDTAEISALQTAYPDRLVTGGGGTFKISANLAAGFSLIDGQVVDTRMVTAVDDYGVIGLGYNALANNTYIPEVHAASGGRFFASGNCIVAIGYKAMEANTTGRRMVALGYRSLTSNTTGFYNTGLGSHTLESCTTGYQNMAGGVQALQSLTTGYDNVALGNGSGVGLGTGARNSFGGSESGRGVTNGNDNAFWGYQAGGGPAAGGLSQSVAFGSYALKTATGNDNSMGGFRAGQDVTSGARNSGWGKDALVTLTSGQDCTAVGNQAAQNVATNSFVTAVGSYSLANCTAAGATAAGYQSGRLVTTALNFTAFGCNAGRTNATGDNCSYFGSQCFEVATGGTNSGFGRAAGINITTGGSNTAIGESALASETTGDGNTAVGKGANGNGNGYSNTTSLGQGAEPTGSNQVTLGNASVSAIRAAVTTITAISDQRLKTPVGKSGALDPEAARALIAGVQVADFVWNDKAPGRVGTREAGVYAQQLHAAAEGAGLGWMDLATEGDDERPWEATPGKLLFPLIAAVQSLMAEVAALKAEAGQ